ncbi:unnamed protein product [Rhizoctonia solani]|uniref:Uncharacterized protein n=1 Tax=Rhizoctonia solani TaxID=456999 RepID=A0A8H3DZ88_9AGAM|nr:unnamed protein product [Rhizoctonia solani]
MVGGHLLRTGYRHGVFATAALSALVAAMYTQSSFIYPVSETTYNSLPILSDAYINSHRFATGIIVLNAITCALTFLMSLVLDWHFAIRTPAYIEFVWVHELILFHDIKLRSSWQGYPHLILVFAP